MVVAHRPTLRQLITQVVAKSPTDMDKLLIQELNMLVAVLKPTVERNKMVIDLLVR